MSDSEKVRGGQTDAVDELRLDEPPTGKYPEQVPGEEVWPEALDNGFSPEERPGMDQRHRVDVPLEEWQPVTDKPGPVE